MTQLKHIPQIIVLPPRLHSTLKRVHTASRNVLDKNSYPQMSISYPRKLISIIIPTLNEQEGIKKTIQSIPHRRILELGYNLEIIIIDGNSTDLTREVAERMGTTVILEKRRGYGRAFKTGFSEAKGDILVTLDADRTYPAELIPEYIRSLNEKGLDFITVNRFSEIQDGAMAPYHRFGNNVLSMFMRISYSVEVRDSQSGMWIMSRDFINRINIASDGFSMPEEINIIAFTFFKALELNKNVIEASVDLGPQT
ncbi:MAG TPA: glycosyltransferase family 2 protein [Nitrososphaeraceae archaeon]|nr:glycosyltransferase family 2 protein [Nitrososphaeraceae archaeon]